METWAALAGSLQRENVFFASLEVLERALPRLPSPPSTRPTSPAATPSTKSKPSKPSSQDSPSFIVPLLSRTSSSLTSAHPPLIKLFGVAHLSLANLMPNGTEKDQRRAEALRLLALYLDLIQREHSEQAILRQTRSSFSSTTQT